MMLHITDATVASDTISVETLDIYKVYSVKNVKSYAHSNYTTWDIECCAPGSVSSGIERVYFVIDTHAHDAFGHWVFESAIYLPLFNILKVRHPTIKLLLTEPRTYKRIFCKYMGISEDDIVYRNDLVYSITTTTDSSVYYFPSPISALNQAEITEDYMRHVNRFWSFFRRERTGHYPLVVLPRQQRENYVGNDRVVPFSEIINYANTVPNSRIVHTDTIEDLSVQIQAIADANVVVVTDGSPFLVNGMFSYDKDIVISGQSRTIGQGYRFKKMAYIINKIRGQNKSVSYIGGQADTCNRVRQLMRGE